MDRSVPLLSALRSAAEATSSVAWDIAYPLLWEAGMRVAAAKLEGEAFRADREDAVSTALTQLVRGIVEGRGNSFNQIDSWDDVLGMMRHIVRQRITDLHRSRFRNREDATEDLPEPTPDTLPDPEFRLSELLAEVDRLDPPLPDLFRDRFVEGWSTDEIASRRAMNRNTILSHFAKGFAILRKRLGPHR
jgi:RNA polymerase sigma factor (sigma-70 family)